MQQNKEKEISSNQATWGQLIEVHETPPENPEFYEDFPYQIPWHHFTKIRFSQPVADDTDPILGKKFYETVWKIPMEFLVLFGRTWNCFWLVVEPTPLKNICQIGSFPQVGMNPFKTMETTTQVFSRRR